MTPDERENLVKDMAQSMVPLPLHLFTKGEQQRAIDAATAALAIAERAIREDYANIINYENNKRYILASIPEKKL